VRAPKVAQKLVRRGISKRRCAKVTTFLKDTFVLKYVINEPYTGKHSTYVEKNTDFSGAREMQELM
jgi:hypothetical protein